MKKPISVLLAVCVLLCGFLLPSAAQDDRNVISLRLNSDVEGCTEADAEKLLEIRSAQVTYRVSKNRAISIDNAASFPAQEPMQAGRTYYVTYDLSAVEGYTLPDALEDGDIVLECGKGVSVICYRIVDYYNGRSDDGVIQTERVLQIVAEVVVDGNILQRIAGWFSDLILKIRSWQLF